MRRYFETLFRMKEVFLVPLVIVPLIAVTAVLLIGTQQTVRAAVWVETSRFTDPARLARSTPADIEAQAMTERLATESFRTEVMTRIGLAEAIQQGKWPVRGALQRKVGTFPLVRHTPLGKVARLVGLGPPESVTTAMGLAHKQIEKSIQAGAVGYNLVEVTYTGKEPAVGRQLLAAVIALHNEKTVALRGQGIQTNVEFFAHQAEIQKARVDDAANTLRQFLEQYPDPIAGQTRPASEQAQLDKLQSNYALEQTIYESALNELEQTRVAGGAVLANRNDSFLLIDPPDVSDAQASGLRKTIMIAFLGLVLGAGLGTLPIILLTWTDPSVRTREDVQDLAKGSLLVQAPLVPLSHAGQRIVRFSVAQSLARGGRSNESQLRQGS